MGFEPLFHHLVNPRLPALAAGLQRRQHIGIEADGGGDFVCRASRPAPTHGQLLAQLWQRMTNNSPLPVRWRIGIDPYRNVIGVPATDADNPASDATPSVT